MAFVQAAKQCATMSLPPSTQYAPQAGGVCHEGAALFDVDRRADAELSKWHAEHVATKYEDKTAYSNTAAALYGALQLVQASDWQTGIGKLIQVLHCLCAR